MIGLIFVFVFTALVAVPGFYIITRKIFPKMSKRRVCVIAVVLTVILLTILGVNLLITPSATPQM